MSNERASSYELRASRERVWLGMGHVSRCNRLGRLRLEDALLEFSSMLNRLPRDGCSEMAGMKGFKVSWFQSFKAQQGGSETMDAETGSLPFA